jgi:hypothetical protein
LHVEALYAVHDAPEENSSPSYAPTQGPSPLNGNISPPSYTIPLGNPGLRAILPLLDPAVAAAARARGAVTASGLQWRPLGSGGNPLTGEGKKDERLFDGYRVSASLDGELGEETGWDVGLTYSENSREANTPDMLAFRLQAALAGFGGPNCTPGAGAGSAGCLYLNPFSNAFANNPAIGMNNTLNFDPALANDPALIDWLFENMGYEDTSSALIGQRSHQHRAQSLRRHASERQHQLRDAVRRLYFLRAAAPAGFEARCVRRVRRSELAVAGNAAGPTGAALRGLRGRGRLDHQSENLLALAGARLARVPRLRGHYVPRSPANAAAQ